MNLPNALTLARLASIPLLVVLMVTGRAQMAAVVFLAASATDTLDGQLARRRGEVTELGKFLDPLADKLLILSALVVLVEARELEAWIVVVIFSREMLITILRSVGASQGRVVAATPWGKTKTVTQIGAVLLLILERPYPLLGPAAQVAIMVAVLFTIASGLDYLWRFQFIFRRHPRASRELSSVQVEPLAGELGEALRASGQSIAVAESCTGGLVAAMITDLPGSSDYFKGGVVAYANEVKKGHLGVPESVLASVGAVSRETAEAMAIGVRKSLGADFGVAVTGIAGPASDATGKPVGLTYVAVAGPSCTEVVELHLQADRGGNRHQAARAALRLALEQVAEHGIAG